MLQSILEQEHQGKSNSIQEISLTNHDHHRYGIAPRLLEPGSKPRIEVFNPCDESDDQKTSTAILFDDQGEFLAFGSNALQLYAEMLDDEETAMLF